jgi:hypothetical protein
MSLIPNSTPQETNLAGQAAVIESQEAIGEDVGMGSPADGGNVPSAGVPTQSERSHGASLRWNFSWTFVGNIIYSACQWAILVVLAKIGNAEMVGQYGLAMAVATPILALSSL